MDMLGAAACTYTFKQILWATRISAAAWYSQFPAGLPVGKYINQSHSITLYSQSLPALTSNSCPEFSTLLSIEWAPEPITKVNIWRARECDLQISTVYWRSKQVTLSIEKGANQPANQPTGKSFTLTVFLLSLAATSHRTFKKLSELRMVKRLSWLIYPAFRNLSWRTNSSWFGSWSPAWARFGHVDLLLGTDPWRMESWGRFQWHLRTKSWLMLIFLMYVHFYVRVNEYIITIYNYMYVFGCVSIGASTC